MKRCMLVGVSVLAVVLLSAPASLLSQALERSLYVSMLDKAGMPVPNLGPADFVVREDNVSREVLRVVPASDPMQIAILVDTSVAATGFIVDVRRALPAFIEKLTVPTASGGRNEVAIVTLGSRPQILEDSLEAAPLVKATDRLWAEATAGGYYLLDGIIEISQGFKARESARPIIVAIVSEGLELSSRHPEQVLTPMRQAGAAFHAIRVGLPVTSIENEDRFRDQVLDDGPRMTGGTQSQLLVGTAMAGKLTQLAAVLTNAYKVTYAHPDSLIPPERVTVAARRSDITAYGTPIKETRVRR
jgi:hypothetical protein